MSDVSAYIWRSKYSSMNAPMMKRLKELKDENRLLKKRHAEEKLQAEIASGVCK